MTTTPKGDIPDTAKPFRLRFQVINQPNGKPDEDREIIYPSSSPVHTMFRFSQPGATIVQTQGEYVRTWTLLGEVTDD